jgi:branched-chain amino acid transport system permease protein
MLFAPRGIMGLREFRWFVPWRDLQAHHRVVAREESHGSARSR